MGSFLASSRYRKIYNLKIFRGLRPLDLHQGSLLDLLKGLQHPSDPQLQKAMTFDKTQLKFPYMCLDHKTVSVLICSLQNVLEQFTRPRHFFKSPSSYLPENIWGTTRCVTEGCSKARSVISSFCFVALLKQMKSKQVYFLQAARSKQIANKLL